MGLRSEDLPQEIDKIWKAIKALKSTTGDGSGVVVKDEGIALPQRAAINLIGSAVAATDNATTNTTDITVTASTTFLSVEKWGND